MDDLNCAAELGYTVKLLAVARLVDNLLNLARIEVTFDNLAPTRAQNPWESGTRVHPMLVREYELAARQGETWSVLVREDDNHHRFRVHSFAPVRTSQIRLRVLATHGEGGQARVYRIACYAEPCR